jgi:hypothetical protein
MTFNTINNRLQSEKDNSIENIESRMTTLESKCLSSDRFTEIEARLAKLESNKNVNNSHTNTDRMNHEMRDFE